MMNNKDIYQSVNRNMYKLSDNSKIIYKSIELKSVDKRNYIKLLHTKILNVYPHSKILEVSTKSEEPVGRELSAFNLKYPLYPDVNVENVFQSSKVFEQGGPFLDLLRIPPSHIKKQLREKNPGKFVGFKKDGIDYPTEPKSIFYDWLYVTSFIKNFDKQFQMVLNYDTFTDIEFNPDKSFNCQAKSLAIAIIFCKNNLRYKDIENFESFRKNYSLLKFKKIEDNCQFNLNL